MEKEKIQKNIASVRFHTKIVIRGLLRTIYGAAVAGLIGLAVFGFVCITKETGWDAVCDFITSCATLFVAVLNIYMMGRPRKAAKNG
jgi:hypothetical protein